jgi:hypothetical protein
VVIVTSAPAIISALVFIFLIQSPVESTLPVLPLDIFFLAIFINPVILSYRFRYYKDSYPRLLY